MTNYFRELVVQPCEQRMLQQPDEKVTIMIMIIAHIDFFEV